MIIPEAVDRRAATLDGPVIVNDHVAARRYLPIERVERLDRALVHVAVESEYGEPVEAACPWEMARAGCCQNAKPSPSIGYSPLGLGRPSNESATQTMRSVTWWAASTPRMKMEGSAAPYAGLD
jgi:hypothetical protein